MRLFPPVLEIGEEEGFTNEKDIFGRKTMGNGLTNIISKVSDPLVIAVDSEWGSGKTTFLKMWAGELRKQKIPVIFFDAFQHDYVEDAFTAIAGEMISLATEKKKQNEPTTKRFVKSSVGAAKIILRSGLKIGVKLATAGALDAADIGEIGSDVAKEASDLEDKYVGELVTKQKQEKDTIQAFRNALELLPSFLATMKDESHDDSKPTSPLIIIVDELDRCRPDFALQILERIKHFFSVPSVHFVLGVHIGQLRNSVSAVYGSGIDAAKYLQKFINLTLHLTESSAEPHRRTTTVYIDYLMNEMMPERQLETSFAFFKEYLRHLAHGTGLSLRAIEKIMTTLSISLSYRPRNIFSSDPILIGLCALKIVNPDLYASAKSGAKIFEEAKGSLAFTIAPDDREKYAVEHMIKVWRYFSDPAVADDDPEFRGFGNQLWNFNLERSNVVGFVARNIVDRLSD